MAKQYAGRNSLDLDGRLTADLKLLGNDSKVAVFTIACNRYIGDNAPENVQSADFIPCKCFGKNLDWMKGFTKGMPVTVEGRMESGSYVDKNGKNVYEVYLNVSRIQPLGSISRDGQHSEVGNGDEFINIPDGYEGLPFN